MRLDDARRIVLSWLDPERLPRIDAAYYVTEGEMHDVGFGEDDHFVNMINMGRDERTPFPANDSPHLLVVVAASSQGQDLLDADGQFEGKLRTLINRDLEWPSLCTPVRASRRQQVVALFNGATGARLSEAAVASAESAAKLTRLVAFGCTPLNVATPLALPPPTTTRTTTRTTSLMATDLPLPPLPSDAATPRSLAEGEVPVALVDAVREMPLVNGAQSVYRFAHQFDGVRWTKGVVTRTVEAAWQIAPDAMLVRERRQISKGGDLYWFDAPVRYWFVLPEGVVGNLGRASVAEARGTLAAPAVTPVPNSRSKVALSQFLRLPLRAQDIAIDFPFEVLPPSPVDAPAGAFPSCHVVHEVLGAGSGSASWLCPGVGLVRYQMQGCYGMTGHSETMELLRYSIPPIRPLGKDD